MRPQIKSSFYLILFIFLCHCYASGNTPQQQLAYFRAQIDSAQQEMNAPEVAAAYSKIVELCRNTPSLENELPENLYQYGLWSSYSGNYQTAIQIHIELLNMLDGCEDESLRLLKAQANMHLGVTCFFLEHWDDALLYYQKAKEIATELGNIQGVSIAENNIGNIYQKKGDFQQAIRQYQQSLLLQEEIGDQEAVCNTYFNIGSCYKEMKLYEKSLPFFDQALAMAKEIGESEIHALSLIELAHYHAIEKKEFYQAEQLIAEAEKLAEKAGFFQVLEEVYRVRSEIEEKQGHFALALEYHKKYKALSDTLFNEYSVDKLHEYEVRYQTQEKELEILRQQAEISHHKTLQYIYIIGLSVAALLVLLFVYIIILRTKRNRELRQINSTKDKFFTIISHDLKNPAIAQRNAIQLLHRYGAEWEQEVLHEYYTELLASAEGEVELLNSLLNWAQVQTGRMPYHPDTFDLAEVIRPEITMADHLAAQKNIALVVRMPEHIMVTGDRNMLTTIIRNLLTNAIKFTREMGKIELEITPSNQEYLISVCDNGVGMSTEQMQNLFFIDKQQSRAGTAGEWGSGLGLIVTKEFIEKHGSTLHVESEPEKGSRFWFFLTFASHLK